MESITKFPLSNKFYPILAVGDRFSKMEIFISTSSPLNSLDLDQIFIIHLAYKHILPVGIVIYRCSLFVSSFWTNLHQKLRISRDLSTDLYAETYGHKEILNRIIEEYLWMYFSYHQDNWHMFLPLAECSYNNAEHPSPKQ
ncbi:hypothetical protein O181_043280 [Austropuccinia psidii MF-1]|uniref:Integrase catalytic domain-containing protein n=1 Tax=Austropuccinia psidii MF-1 TaxID=1389203 RepID=A0A9Q3DI39_9BASI|nr:hypothetical protein [Austropuccinia psidii MF-1]